MGRHPCCCHRDTGGARDLFVGPGRGLCLLFAFDVGGGRIEPEAVVIGTHRTPAMCSMNSNSPLSFSVGGLWGPGGRPFFICVVRFCPARFREVDREVIKLRRSAFERVEL